jgi:glucose/arabinose dehydrogenase
MTTEAHRRGTLDATPGGGGLLRSLRLVLGTAFVASSLTGGLALATPGSGSRGAVGATTTNSSLAAVVVPLPPTPPTTDSFVASRVRLSLVRVAQGLQSPLFVTHAPGSSRLFIVEKGGRIRILSSGTLLSTPFLDIHTRVSGGGEQGLLGLAFHPSYATNRKFYVDYTDVNGNTVIAEHTASSTNRNRANTTGRVLLRITQPYANHNGGMLAFGRDGYLYIGMGDGGSAGDPGNRAQSKTTLLGKLLRIDVNHRRGSLPYAVPSTNPYVGRFGLDQIWSRGLRNPWRFSFDRLTGDLWIGDVGQDRYEEIDRARRASGGGRGVNFGWRVLEGRACYNPSSGCSTTGKQMPIAVYSHTLGCSVTGGYVYRGTRYPVLVGGYLFADYCSGRIWSLVANGASSQTPQLLLASGHAISSFGEGSDGTLYVTDLASGYIFRIVASAR